MRILVIETPPLPGCGVADWLARQGGFEVQTAAALPARCEAEVLLFDLAGSPDLVGELRRATQLRGPRVLALCRDPAELPAALCDWLGAALLRVPVEPAALLAALYGEAETEAGSDDEAQHHHDGDSLIGAWASAFLSSRAETSHAATEAAGPADGPLSARERQIAALIARGFSNAEIGSQLFLSVGTVRKHRENLMRKLDVRNAQMLTRWALRDGLVTPDDLPGQQDRA
ncbi:helix-turn-helix transcriptional regulator [Chitinimonas koreensis]|uniref:helix-turn-helix transcriptional regulator n=1 Tax=Chitinimonas koreensis TaxID=356302 RepID=UPI000419FE98|nr:response regulator transcription factor [Chitinimonas koreensis]QNM98300.1 response regulator transcription factor [Chitinimonas koreensis]